MKTTPMTPPLYDYVISHCDLPHPVLAKVAQITRDLPGAQMQISADQGALMSMLVQLMNAKKILEIGCFTGYSAICMATALPKDGRLITMDINEETSKLAQGFFKEAGLQDKIDLRLGDAQQGCQTLKQEYGTGAFDMAFIDADKASLWSYFNHCLDLVRPGGLIAVDNVIWDGKVVEQTDQSNSTAAIRDFNMKVRQDQRVEHVMLHIADGLYLLRKKL